MLLYPLQVPYVTTMGMTRYYSLRVHGFKFPWKEPRDPVAKKHGGFGNRVLTFIAHVISQKKQYSMIMTLF
jgi:hypothetical protein